MQVPNQTEKTHPKLQTQCDYNNKLTTNNSTLTLNRADKEFLFSLTQESLTYMLALA